MGKVPSFLVEVSSSYCRFVVAAFGEVIEVNDFFSQLLRSLAFAAIDSAHPSLRSKRRYYSSQARADEVEKRSALCSPIQNLSKSLHSCEEYST